MSEMKRVLRVRDGLAITVGIVIGAGILRTPGLIAEYLGNGWLILSVWVLGGVVAALSTLVLAEMAAALPKAGGKYVYAREAFGPVGGLRGGLVGAAGDGSGLIAPPTVQHASLLGFALAYQSVAFAYYGWEDAAKMAEEIRDPGRSLPRILIGGVVVVAVLYLLVNTAYLAALTPQEMAGSELVARDAVQGVFGNTAATFVVVASLLILISSGNVNFLGMPRVAFALARAGLAPKVFRYVSPRGTPVAGLLLIGTLILVLASTGALEFLIQFMMLVAISVDLMVLSAFFRLRRTRRSCFIC